MWGGGWRRCWNNEFIMFMEFLQNLEYDENMRIEWTCVCKHYRVWETNACACVTYIKLVRWNLLNTWNSNMLDCLCIHCNGALHMWCVHVCIHSHHSLCLHVCLAIASCQIIHVTCMLELMDKIVMWCLGMLNRKS